MPGSGAKTICLFLAALVAISVCGCHQRRESAGGARSPTAPAAPEWPRYDDPRLTEDERRAIRAATEAVLDPKRARPDFDKAFRYRVSQDADGWWVTVFHVSGFENGKPQFHPDGYTDVQLDRNFSLLRKMGGG